MNKNSLFFKITLFFIAMIVMTHIIIFMGYNITQQNQIDITVVNYMKSLHRTTENILGKRKKPEHIKFHNRPPPPRGLPIHELMQQKEKFKTVLEMYDLELSSLQYEVIKNEGNLIAKEFNWELYKYNGFKYFYIKEPFVQILLKDTIKIRESTQYIIILTILLNILFITFYLFLLKKLLPLRKLKQNISQFSKGDLNIDTSSLGTDEISDVSNEFNNAIKEIKLLTNSRNLFLRNIMHELKTPITKGLLISNMLEESKFKNSLKKAFFRLEFLLNEFSRIEKFTSNNMTLQLSEFRMVDIVDHSLDILLTNLDSIKLIVIDNSVVKVDFELFTLAVKNIVDNAIKYGEGKPTIIIEDSTLTIKNKGIALEKPVEEYNKPFNKKYENSNNGLGLGLYIVNHILKLHNLNLEHNYDEEKHENVFRIMFKKTNNR